MMMTIAKPFEEGLRQQKLLLPWCKSCGKPHFYPRSACPHCWGDEYEWRPALGAGVIHTFTVVRANPPTAFKEHLPYVVAIIDLDEGVRMMSNIVDFPSNLAIGDRVSVTFVERHNAILPLFRRLP